MNREVLAAREGSRETSAASSPRAESSAMGTARRGEQTAGNEHQQNPYEGNEALSRAWESQNRPIVILRGSLDSQRRQLSSSEIEQAEQRLCRLEQIRDNYVNAVRNEHNPNITEQNLNDALPAMREAVEEGARIDRELSALLRLGYDSTSSSSDDSDYDDYPPGGSVREESESPAATDQGYGRIVRFSLVENAADPNTVPIRILPEKSNIVYVNSNTARSSDSSRQRRI